MDEAALWTSVFERMTNDTGVGGLFDPDDALITGAFNSLAPSSQAFPYLVFSVASATPDDTFERNVIRYQIRFTAYTDRKMGMQSSSNIMTRVYQLFHRHVLTLTSDWKASAMRLLDGAGRTVDDNAYGVVHDYEVYLTEE